MCHHSQCDSCNCCCDLTAMLSCIHNTPAGCSCSRERSYIRIRTYTRARMHTYCYQYRITRGRDFFITVRADCIFLRLPTTRVSNLENRVEGGPSNHVFLAIVSCVDPRHPRSASGHPFIPAPACPHPWTQSSSRENEEPFIRWL